MGPPYKGPTPPEDSFEYWAFGPHGPATVGEFLGDILTGPLKLAIWRLWVRRHRQT